MTQLAEADVEALLDAVGEDPALAPEEKETTIRFGKDEGRATIYTPETGLMRRLLVHPESDVKFVDVLDEDARARAIGLEAYAGEDVIGVTVTLPVGALQIKSRARKSNQHAEIVSGRVLSQEGDA